MRKQILPAAAAGSETGFFTSLFSLVEERSLGSGLLLRLESDGFDAGGDLDLRSKRDGRGAGSVWSNLERFAARLSESSIL